LPADVTEPEVRMVFQLYGELRHVALSAPDGCATVAYVRRDSAEMAINLLDGRYRMRRDAPECVTIRWKVPKPPLPPVKDAFKVFVDKLPDDCVESHLRMVFSHYGEVLSVELMPSASHNGCRSALVSYADEQSAHDAVQVLDSRYHFRADAKEPIIVQWVGQGTHSRPQQQTSAGAPPPSCISGGDEGAGPSCEAIAGVVASAPDPSQAQEASFPEVAGKEGQAAVAPEEAKTEGIFPPTAIGGSSQMSPTCKAYGVLLQEHTSSVRLIRVGRESKLEKEMDEVVLVPVIKQVEKVVEKQKEVIVHELRYVDNDNRPVHRIEQIEEVEGPVVYVDTIKEVEVDMDVDMPVVKEIERVIPRTFEVVHHVPRFVSVPQEVERVVQEPVETTVERVVQVERVVPKEVYIDEEVVLVREVPKIIKDIVKVPLKVQLPNVIKKQVPVVIPTIKYVENVVMQDVTLTHQVVEERTLAEAASQVQVLQEQEVEVADIVRKPKYVEVPQVEYVERVVETFTTRRVPIDVPNTEPLVEVVKKRVEIPRVEYVVKEVPVPRVRRPEKIEEVEKEVRTHETHHITGKLSEETIVKYLDRFVDVPNVVTEYVDITVDAIVVRDKVEEIPIINEVIRYEEVEVEKVVHLRRPKPVIKEVEIELRVPEYVFEEVREMVDVEFEEAVVVNCEEVRHVERLQQQPLWVEEVKEVVVGKKAGRAPQCLSCLKSMQHVPGDALSGGASWRCLSCNLTVPPACNG